MVSIYDVLQEYIESLGYHSPENCPYKKIGDGLCSRCTDLVRDWENIPTDQRRIFHESILRKLES
jgi:hypothetical protein